MMKKLLMLVVLGAWSLALAQTNLPSLPTGTTLSGNELILMQQPPTACNGCTVTTTPTAIVNFAASALIPAQTGFAGCPLVTNGTSYTWNCTLGNLTTGNLAAGAVSMTSCTVNSATCSTATSASPSGSVGLSAVSGSTGHWMDAGSAPALSQAISPTWTGNHVFEPGSGVPITAYAPSGMPAQELYGASSNWTQVLYPASTSSYGQVVEGGSTIIQELCNSGCTAPYVVVYGDGGITVNSPTGGDKGPGTINLASGVYVNGTPVVSPITGSYTAGLWESSTCTGTEITSGTLDYAEYGNIVVLFAPGNLDGTISASQLSINIPSAINPTVATTATGFYFVNNSITTLGLALIDVNASDCITLNVLGPSSPNTVATDFSAGTSGIVGGWSITYTTE